MRFGSAHGSLSSPPRWVPAFPSSSLILTSDLVVKSFTDLLRAPGMAESGSLPSPYRDSSVVLGRGLLQALHPGVPRPTQASILEPGGQQAPVPERAGTAPAATASECPRANPGGTVRVHPQAAGDERKCLRLLIYKCSKPASMSSMPPPLPVTRFSEGMTV